MEDQIKEYKEVVNRVFMYGYEILNVIIAILCLLRGFNIFMIEGNSDLTLATLFYITVIIDIALLISYLVNKQTYARSSMIAYWVLGIIISILYMLHTFELFMIEVNDGFTLQTLFALEALITFILCIICLVYKRKHNIKSDYF